MDPIIIKIVNGIIVNPTNNPNMVDKWNIDVANELVIDGLIKIVTIFKNNGINIAPHI